MKAIFYCLLAIVAVSIADESSVEKSGNLKCYKCNSAFVPDCDSPLNKTAAQRYLVDCTDESFKPALYKGKNPVGCRIIDTTVMEQDRIVRECAYSGHNVQRVKHAGNKGVISYITQCDESECNTAKPVSVVSASAVLIPVVVAIILRY
ncbi:hypothetical protein TTRE_0000095001 [Trichuris trichiura]|uniref:Protein quiver n=1 Tax=Trichuris trichiura TaxID=36087 RepID=A0A077YZ22_TRITR|nr:hypothetical protein TTRE_0000095001 [Trichuris trichiura]